MQQPVTYARVGDVSGRIGGCYLSKMAGRSGSDAYECGEISQKEPVREAMTHWPALRIFG